MRTTITTRGSDSAGGGCTAGATTPSARRPARSTCIPVRELRPVIAVDGNTVRGATDDDGRQPHLVAALDP
jgi:hypothetical protein